MDAFEINQLIRQGSTVWAKVPAFDTEQKVFRARCGTGNHLQVRFCFSGQYWNVEPTSLRVEKETSDKPV